MMKAKDDLPKNELPIDYRNNPYGIYRVVSSGDSRLSVRQSGNRVRLFLEK